MTVKELIVELLDCNLDSAFDIDIKTSEVEINEHEFNLVSNSGYTTLTIKPDDYVLIHKDDYEELLEQSK
ncbi:hypothetical protein [Halalkalibacter oceani]|uniref:hypothetical protein n=1 Tax=Halalkalibacter oceani TaxID=1653776 RepID=UPI003393F168